MGEISAIRGVNLGGWLVLESWITPSLFQLCSTQDERELLSHASIHTDVLNEIKKHRDTFITPQDFQCIKQRGFNSVRLPIAWHTVYGTHALPQLKGLEYLDFCMEQARLNGLSVLIDLHVAPGGQNNFDYSGSEEEFEWHLDASYREKTLLVLDELARRYKHEEALFGIELLNEPVISGFKGLSYEPGIPAHYLRNFYRSAYDLLRTQLDVDKAIVLHDAFRPQMWKHFMKASKYENIWWDIHIYHCFGKQAENLHERKVFMQAMKQDAHSIAELKRSGKPVLIGEWSAGLAIPQQAMTPEGRKAFERLFIRRQLKEFSQADGWYFWNYKTESSLSGWDSRSSLAFVEQEVLKA